MSEKTDDIKGRAKEAAGAVTGNESLKREGKTDQVASKIKGAIKDAEGKIEEGIDAVTDKVHKK
ncbi:MAG: CsbD family protein [Acidimicrobiales bacterium]|jgi:uncharacterized protein YjbJ (UPF0337 family)